MQSKLIKKINNRSDQKSIHPNIEQKLRPYKAEDRIMYYNVPPLDEKDLYEFCTNFDAFGKDKGQTRKYIQFYIIYKFMNNLGPICRGKVEGPINLSLEERSFGDCELVGKDNGLSAFIYKKIWNEGQRKEEKVQAFELSCIYKINFGQSVNVVASYASAITAWKDAFKKSIAKKFKERGARPHRANLGSLEEVGLVSDDRLTNAENFLRTIFPGCDDYNIIFAYNIDEFEKKLFRDSPSVWILHRNKSVNMLLHTLSWLEIEKLANRLHGIHSRQVILNQTPQITTSQFYQTVRKRLVNMVEDDKLKPLKTTLISLLDEFERQIDHFVALNQQFPELPEHPNNRRYLGILKSIPKYYKSQPFGEDKAFEKNYFWKPVNSIVCEIDKKIIDNEEKFQAKKMVLEVPYYKGKTPLEILNLNEFPYNFPHFYLTRLSSALWHFRGSTLKELQSRMKNIKEQIEKKDVFYHLKRLSGSFEMGKRR